MNRRAIWSVMVSAILLILPVVLILVFDKAAWKSRWNLFDVILGTLFFVDVPIAVCLWHWFWPRHFRGIRWVAIFGLLTLFSWVVMAGGMWLACIIGHGPDNGFSAVCAYLFGWAYLWITLVPIGAVYLLFCGAWRLLHRKGAEGGMSHGSISRE